MRRLKWWEAGAILFAIVVLAILILPMFARSRESARRSSCQNNLKQMGLVFKMYANESRGERYPPLSPIADNWLPDLAQIYPEYLTDLSILICPSSPANMFDPFTLKNTLHHPSAEIGTLHPDCVSSQFYNYTGFAMIHDGEAWAFYDAYKKLGAAQISTVELQVTLPEWSNEERSKMYRGGIPIMWDRVCMSPEEFSHNAQFVNVLHLDGSVRQVRYATYNSASNFPVTYLSAQTFGSGVPKISHDCY